MWKKLKAIVRRPFEGLIGATEEPPSPWSRAEAALRRAQRTQMSRRMAGAGRARS